MDFPSPEFIGRSVQDLLCSLYVDSFCIEKTFPAHVALQYQKDVVVFLRRQGYTANWRYDKIDKPVLVIYWQKDVASDDDDDTGSNAG